MATEIESNTKKSTGIMFFDNEVVDAYTFAKEFAGENGRVATMPDIVEAKITADENGPLWTNWFTTTSGEFYGESKGGVPIVVVRHGVDEILQDESIVKRSLKNLRDNPFIQLTSRQFRLCVNSL